MQLTKFTDYSLRVLMYVASKEGQLVTIDEMSKIYKISNAHLMKVVNTLTRENLLIAVRGRSGGLRLAKLAQDYRLDEIIKLTEPNFALVECMSNKDSCLISHCCTLPKALAEANKAFLTALSHYTLKDFAVLKDFVKFEK